MARTTHSRRPRTARNTRDDVTQVRQPRPARRRTATRQAFIAAAIREA
jgi:hypothetical protein